MKKFFPFILVALISCKKEDIQLVQAIKETTVSQKIVDTNFYGYKVDSLSLLSSLNNDNGISYWKNNNILPDLIVYYFQKSKHITGSRAINGDFNGDGYVDVFSPGAIQGKDDAGRPHYVDTVANIAFLIWDPKQNKYIEQNLLTGPIDSSLIYGPSKMVSVNINNDQYTDMVIFGHSDEQTPGSTNQGVSLLVSNSSGKYTLTKLDNLIPENLKNFTIEGGDVGDLNGDKIPDLFVACNSHTYIFWGISSYPYFTTKNYAHFARDYQIFPSDNGFGEIVPEGAGDVYTARISDVNGDGKNDILLGRTESLDNHQRIMINQGNGHFTSKGTISLPYAYNSSPSIIVQDYVITDNKEIIALVNNLDIYKYDNWGIVLYTPTTDGNYSVSTILPISNSSWKTSLVYYDFNKDGIKDISYVESVYNPTTIKQRKVYQKNGNSYIERNYFEFDQYLNRF